MNVEGFKSQFKDMARDNRFLVFGTAIPPLAYMFCINAQVPAVSVATLEHRDGQHSAPWKLPYDSILSEAVLTFRDDEEMSNRKWYEEWYKTIVSSGGFGYYDDFARDRTLFIQQLDRSGKTIMQWDLREVYPISLSEIQYDHTAQNTFTTFTVTLAYHEANWIGEQ